MYSYLYLEGGFFSFCFFNIRVNWFANWKVSMVEGLHTRPPPPSPPPAKADRPVPLEQRAKYFLPYFCFTRLLSVTPTMCTCCSCSAMRAATKSSVTSLWIQINIWSSFLVLVFFFHCRVPAQIWATRGGHCAPLPHRASMHWRAPWGLWLDAKISVPKKKIDRQEDNDNLFYSILRQIISQFYRVITPMTMSSSEFSVNYRLPEWRQFKWQREGACHLGGGKGQVRTMPSCSRRRPSHTAF